MNNLLKIGAIYLVFAALVGYVISGFIGMWPNQSDVLFLSAVGSVWAGGVFISGTFVLSASKQTELFLGKMVAHVVVFSLLTVLFTFILRCL